VRVRAREGHAPGTGTAAAVEFLDAALGEGAEAPSTDIARIAHAIADRSLVRAVELRVGALARLGDGA
jgi:hypothetical protein